MERLYCGSSPGYCCFSTSSAQHWQSQRRSTWLDLHIIKNLHSPKEYYIISRPVSEKGFIQLKSRFKLRIQITFQSQGRTGRHPVHRELFSALPHPAELQTASMFHGCTGSTSGLSSAGSPPMTFPHHFIHLHGRTGGVFSKDTDKPRCRCRRKTATRPEMPDPSRTENRETGLTSARCREPGSAGWPAGCEERK